MIISRKSFVDGGRLFALAFAMLALSVTWLACNTPVGGGNNNANQNDNSNSNDNTNGNNNDNTNNNDNMGDDPIEVERISFDAEMGVETVGTIVIAAGDQEADSDLDLFIAGISNPNRGALFGIPNNGDGMFSAITTINDGNDIHTAAKIVVADVDGILGPDMIIADSGDVNNNVVNAPGGIHVFLNRGGGSFALSTQGAISLNNEQPDEIEVVDIDGDGTLDILAVSTVANTDILEILSGNGDGTYGSPMIVQMPSNVGDIAVADLDGDDKMDLIATLIADSEGTAINEVAVFFGDGNGNFGEPTRMDSSLVPYQIEVSDVNNDGILDIVTGHLFANVGIYMGNGDRAFAAINMIEDAPGAFIGVADMDNDGNIDIVGKGPGSSVPVILFGDGEGAFPEFQSFGFVPEVGATKFILVDLNGDSLVDLAMAGAWLVVDGFDVVNFPTIIKLQSN